MNAYGIAWRGKPVGLFARSGWDTQMPGHSKLTGRWLPGADASARRLSELLIEGGHVEVSIEGLADCARAWLSVDEHGEARLYVRRRPIEAQACRRAEMRGDR